MSEQDKSDLNYVLSLAPQGVHHLLDLSDERQHRFLMRQISGAGITEGRYPQFFADLKTCKAAHAVSKPRPLTTPPGGLSNLNLVTAFARDSAGNAAAQGFSSIVGGSIMTQLSMQVFDATTSQLLASNLQPPVYGQGQYQPIQASGNPATSAMRTVLTYSLMTTQGPQHGVVSYTTEERPASDPTLTQPTQNPNRSSGSMAYIRIGLSRGTGSQADVDYWFNQTDWNNPNVTVPLVAQVVFQSNVVTPLDPNTNFQALMYVVKPASGGGQQIILPAGQTLLNFITINPPTQLNINMPCGPNRGDGGTPATFGAAPWASDTVVYFHFQVAVKTGTSGTDFVFANIDSSDQGDTDPIDGTLYIKPLQFVWHCLVAGTRIKMADGTTQPIEALRGGEKVVTDADGSVMTIEATIAQRRNCTILSIQTQDGGKVEVTEEHPMVSPSGVIQAKELHNGIILYTEHGVSPVTNITTRQFDGGLFNVSLVSGAGCGKHGTTLLAGGIAVGDMQIYHTHQAKLRKDPDYIRKHLPEPYHKDFASSLEDAAKHGR